MSKSSSWFNGALLGGLVGSALVLLLTPYSGETLKANITDFIANLRSEMLQAGEEKRQELEEQLEQLRTGSN